MLRLSSFSITTLTTQCGQPETTLSRGIVIFTIQKLTKTKCACNKFCRQDDQSQRFEGSKMRIYTVFFVFPFLLIVEKGHLAPIALPLYRCTLKKVDYIFFLVVWKCCVIVIVFGFQGTYMYIFAPISKRFEEEIRKLRISNDEQIK